jgi:hypothetical protein
MPYLKAVVVIILLVALYLSPSARMGDNSTTISTTKKEDNFTVLNSASQCKSTAKDGTRCPEKATDHGYCLIHSK